MIRAEFSDREDQRVVLDPPDNSRSVAHRDGPAIRHRVIQPIQLSFLVLITGPAGDPLVSSIYARLEILDEGR